MKFLILRALPKLVDVAYRYHYPDEDKKQRNFFQQIAYFFIKGAMKCRLLFKLALLKGNSLSECERNANILTNEFAKIREVNKSVSNEKPVCAYFVSSYIRPIEKWSAIHESVIFGDSIIYYHLYKIEQLQKHYDVYPYVVQNFETLKTKIQEHDKISLIDIVACGIGSIKGGSLSIHDELDLHRKDTEQKLQVIIDSGGYHGKGQIAEELARNNTNSTVFAAKHGVFFSTPQIKVKNNKPKVKSVAHGPCIVTPYWMDKIKSKNVNNTERTR